MAWHKIRLGDSLYIKHGFAFKGRFFEDTGDFLVLTPGNFREGGGFKLRPGKDRFYSGDFPEDYLLEEGDLIIAMTEQGPGLLGSSALIPSAKRYLHNQRLGLVQDLDRNLLDQNFLYFLFNTKAVRAQISGSATGTKVRHTAPERIYQVQVKIPEKVSEQQRIADILSAYDDLIENNRRRIELLEQAARLIYKEWFVHLRFPGHENVPVVDGVPEGWAKSSIGESASFISRGITPKYDPDADGMVINQKCIRNRRVDLSLARSQSKKVPASKLIRFGDVLINSTGQGTLGRVAQFLDQIGGLTVDSHVTIARPKEGCPLHLFGQAVASQEKYLAASGRGATNQTELSKETVEMLPFLWPNSSVSEAFESLVQGTGAQIQNLARQNTKLAEARDLLLPRLMSGQIKV